MDEVFGVLFPLIVIGYGVAAYFYIKYQRSAGWADWDMKASATWRAAWGYSPNVLFIYRGIIFLYIFCLQIADFSTPKEEGGAGEGEEGEDGEHHEEDGGPHASAFTIWSFCLLVFAFGMSVWCSWEGRKQNRSEPLANQEERSLNQSTSRNDFAATLKHQIFRIAFEVAFPVAFFLDFVFWTMLAEEAGADFFGVNQHLLNLFFALGEVALNRLPPMCLSAGFHTLTWVVFYSLTTMILVVGAGAYPMPYWFMEMEPGAFGWYPLLFLMCLLAHWAMMFVSKKINQAKARWDERNQVNQTGEAKTEGDRKSRDTLGISENRV